MSAIVLVQPLRWLHELPSPWMRYEFPRLGPPPNPAGSSVEVAVASGGPYHVSQPHSEKKTASLRPAAVAEALRASLILA